MDRKWTSVMDNIMRQLYGNHSTKYIAECLQMSINAVYCRAYLLQLKKDKSFLSATSKVNALKNEGFLKNSFKKGLVPHNSGKKQTEFLSAEAIERSKATRFKKGHTPHNSKYDGHERISKEGYVEVRISPGVYILKHRKIWEAHYGAIPKGYIIVFKDGNKENCAIENLEMITRDENAIRNRRLGKCPREIQKAEYARVQLNRKIKEYGKK